MAVIYVSGIYWIDPNGGGIADAIKGFCIFGDSVDKAQTCLVPQVEEVSVLLNFEHSLGNLFNCIIMCCFSKHYR